MNWKDAVRGCVILSAGLCLSLFADAKSANPTTAILVDKATNSLEVVEYVEGSFRTVKSYHVTLGQVKGDKEEEGDLKTPEGIYTFKSRLTPPSLKPKFGQLAFYVSYPNAYDRIAGRTGFDIMLHATNEPDRLKQNYDSQGCIVVKDEEILEIQKSIRVGLTPILVFSELTQEYRHPAQDGKLKVFFESWVKAWESKNVEAYIKHYHDDLLIDIKGKWLTKQQLRSYKNSLTQLYKTIRVNPEEVKYYRHPKYSVITFTQNYNSTFNNGKPAHRSRGTKILYVAEGGGEPKIIAEAYTTLMW